MVWNRRKIAGWASFTILGMVGIVGFYFILLCHPGLFFHYRFSRGGITLFSDEPIPPEAAARVLEDVELGPARYWRLPEWKNEGYADLLAKGGDFDFEKAREQLRNGDRDLDPRRSGLYLRHHLFVAYLLDHKAISVGELLHRDFDATQVQAEILASGGREARDVRPR